MKARKTKRTLAITLLIILSVVAGLPQTAKAAGQKTADTISLKIGKEKATKKKYILNKGKKVNLKVTGDSVKTNRTISYKSSNKRIASVSSKGKITAKKAGTARITVTVKEKGGKRKSAYVKIKVVKSHKHVWKKILQTKKVWVEDVPEWDEDLYEERGVCTGCGYIAKDFEDLQEHTYEEKSGYTFTKVKVGTIHHDEKRHCENRTVIADRKCRICGILESQL